MSLSVPEGAVPGTELTVTAPNGQQVTVTVPEGVAAGQELAVEVLSIANVPKMDLCFDAQSQKPSVRASDHPKAQVTLLSRHNVQSPTEQLPLDFSSLCFGATPNEN